MEKVVIIGAGPAGYTAAIYSARANLSPLEFEGIQPGGQLLLTTEVENFPGFPEGIMGPDLMTNMRQQAERFGTRFISDIVSEVDFSKHPFVVKGGGQQIKALSVIIASGASARWLGLPAEQKLMGRGISACATCDGAFFRQKHVVVVGGGDTAMEEAVFLTKFASKVTVVHRRDELRASKIMQERALNNAKVTVVWNSAIDDILGTEKVIGVRLKNTKDGSLSDMEVDGVFMALGHTPNTDIFKGQIDLDKTGYIQHYDNTSQTSVEGVFAAGDVRDSRYRQAITAAGSGCAAAIDAEKWLEAKGFLE